MQFLGTIMMVMLMTTNISQTPLRLSVVPGTSGVELLVVGESDKSLGARYELEVTAGSNRSVQSGSVQLRPGTLVTLVRLNLGGTQARDWNATLSVTLSDGHTYRVEQAAE